MRVISRKPLREFSEKHPQAKQPINAWFAMASKAEWESFASVKSQFGSADVIANNRVIFNLGGNKFRLVVEIAYKTKIVYVLWVGTHSEYDRIDAATVNYRRR